MVFRISFGLGSLPVKSLNWAAAWLMNIDKPSIVFAPACFASFNNRVSAGL